MPTIFTHALVGAVLGRCLAPSRSTPGFLALCAASAAVPDLDAAGLSLWGAAALDAFDHRGFTHSLPFAVLWGLVVAAILWWRDRSITTRGAATLWAVLAVVTATHGVLDAFTDGGSPVEILAPFSDRAWFAPWRPIPVAPISARAFFGPWGLRVLGTEVLLVWLPLLASWAVVELRRRRRGRA